MRADNDDGLGASAPPQIEQFIAHTNRLQQRYQSFLDSTTPYPFSLLPLLLQASPPLSASPTPPSSLGTPRRGSPFLGSSSAPINLAIVDTALHATIIRPSP